MRIILEPEVNRVKNGFAARIPALRLAAHGYSPEMAIRNLERTVLLFLRPFERAGTLERELESVGLEAQGDGGELQVEATCGVTREERLLAWVRLTVPTLETWIKDYESSRDWRILDDPRALEALKCGIVEGQTLLDEVAEEG